MLIMPPVWLDNKNRYDTALATQSVSRLRAHISHVLCGAQLNVYDYALSILAKWISYESDQNHNEQNLVASFD